MSMRWNSHFDQKISHP